MPDSDIPRRRASDFEPPPPQGMTEEQLDYFSQQTRRAVHKALHAYTRRAVVGFLTLLAAFAVNQYRVEHSIDRIQEIRRDRVAAQQKTDIIICENQRVALTRLAATKGIVLGLTEGFAKLRVPKPGVDLDPDAKERARLLAEAGDALNVGIVDLNTRLAKLDCDRLPGNAPFKK